MLAATPLFVQSIIRDPRVWGCVCEDGVRAEDFGYEPTSTYFRLGDSGFIMFRAVTQTMQEIHIAMRRGSKELPRFVDECLIEMRRRGVRKFMAPIGDWNLAAIRLARRCGFVEEGRVTATYVRGGKPRAMVLMGRG